MSSSLPPAHGLGRATRKYIKAVRSGTHNGVIHPRGYLHCISCGGPTMSMADFASHAGVSASQVSAFLNRRTVREDVAKKIRNNLYDVDE